MKQSAGILLYRKTHKELEVLLVHPGGPFWAKKDTGAWSIPKGEFSEDEAPLAAAKREFGEEVGSPTPAGDYTELGSTKYSNKTVSAWACEADLNLASFKSNTFTMEWPPKSGQQQEFPEVDKAAWFSLGKAKTKLVKGQVALLENLADKLGKNLDAEPEPELPQTSLF
jgi:predicted NUDIX family NTP pyrophosphohydrolase